MIEFKSSPVQSTKTIREPTVLSIYPWVGWGRDYEGPTYGPPPLTNKYSAVGTPPPSLAERKGC